MKGQRLVKLTLTEVGLLAHDTLLRRAPGAFPEDVLLERVGLFPQEGKMALLLSSAEWPEEAGPVPELKVQL